MAAMSGRRGPSPPPARPAGTEPSPRHRNPGDLVARSPRPWAPHLWWITLLAGAAGAAFVWLAMPHGREIDTLWEPAGKLLAFACLCCAIAFFPWASPRLHWLVYLPFLGLTGYLLPRISWFYYGDGGRVHGDEFYTHLYLLLYPGIVLTVAAAHRLGGGSPGSCLKIAVNGAVIVFSGLLDLMWFLVNPVEPPEVIDAPHITVLTGGPISYPATVLFALAHVPVVLGVALLPLDRWIGRLLGVAPALPGR